mgnify:FL=1
MHELSLMASLRDLALEQARVHGACRIAAITLRIGSLAGVEPDALRFAHEVVMTGTAAEGARLQIEMVPALFECEPCQVAFAAEAGDCFCPVCGTPSRQLIQGRELQLASLELD